MGDLGPIRRRYREAVQPGPDRNSAAVGLVDTEHDAIRTKGGHRAEECGIGEDAAGGDVDALDNDFARRLEALSKQYRHLIERRVINPVEHKRQRFAHVADYHI